MGRPAIEYSQASRVLMLYRHLVKTEAGYSLNDLALAMEVSRRTVLRDLAAIRDAGVDVRVTDGAAYIKLAT